MLGKCVVRRAGILLSRQLIPSPRLCRVPFVDRGTQYDSLLPHIFPPPPNICHVPFPTFKPFRDAPPTLHPLCPSLHPVLPHIVPPPTSQVCHALRGVSQRLVFQRLGPMRTLDGKVPVIQAIDGVGVDPVKDPLSALELMTTSYDRFGLLRKDDGGVVDAEGAKKDAGATDDEAGGGAFDGAARDGRALSFVPHAPGVPARAAPPPLRTRDAPATAALAMEEVTQFKPTKSSSDRVTSCAWVGDGNHLLVVDNNGWGSIWDVHNDAEGGKGGNLHCSRGRKKPTKLWEYQVRRLAHGREKREGAVGYICMEKPNCGCVDVWMCGCL